MRAIIHDFTQDCICDFWVVCNQTCLSHVIVICEILVEAAIEFSDFRITLDSYSFKIMSDYAESKSKHYLGVAEIICDQTNREIIAHDFETYMITFVILCDYITCIITTCDFGSAIVLVLLDLMCCIITSHGYALVCSHMIRKSPNKIPYDFQYSIHFIVRRLSMG